MKALKLPLFAAALAGGLAALPAPVVAANADMAAQSANAIPAALRPVLYQALAKGADLASAIGKNGCAALPQRKLTACFDGKGARFSGGGSLALQFAAYGRNEKLTRVTPVHPTIAGNQVRYAHGNLTEWWRVLPIGFEQGFTIARRPAGNGTLTLALVASRRDAGTPSLHHSREGGEPAGTISFLPSKRRGIEGDELSWGKFRYGQLVVTDATGKVIPATIRIASKLTPTRKEQGAENDSILIAVNDVHAVYPLTVDPLVWLEQKVAASDGGENDNFGFSIALSGHTALVGAECASFEPITGTCGHGAVYIFVHSDGHWSQTAKLTASDGVLSDAFGSSVALDGATALVGANCAHYDIFADECGPGAAYVFNESGGNWMQTAELTASDGTGGDFFGGSVALDGTTALVGAPSAAVNGNVQQGAVYVFGKSGDAWGQTQKLTANDGASGDVFGLSVALGGGIAFVGAPLATVNGHVQQGAAYVFGESGGAWSQTQKVAADDGAAVDYFGASLALDGATALIGAPCSRYDPVSGNCGPGAAYIFTESDNVWNQARKLTATDGAENDDFGNAVALDGTNALVGAENAKVNGNSQGAAYVFGESGGAWTQTRKLTASDSGAGDNFGTSVAFNGGTLLIGAPYAALDGSENQGAAYFEDPDALNLLATAPRSVYRYDTYLVQAIATNETTAISPAVVATVAVPAAASFVSATSTQGSCGKTADVVTCNFGSIGAGGFAVASVHFEAVGDGGGTIENSASVSNATPKLSDSSPTRIHTCPQGYAEYSGTLAPGAYRRTPRYRSAGGKQTALFSAPADFSLYVGYRKDPESQWEIRRVPAHAIYHYGPAGSYRWQITAGTDGGAWTLCIQHP